jgi:hypothetical protein
MEYCLHIFRSNFESEVKGLVRKYKRLKLFAQDLILVREKTKYLNLLTNLLTLLKYMMQLYSYYDIYK